MCCSYSCSSAVYLNSLRKKVGGDVHTLSPEEISEILARPILESETLSFLAKNFPTTFESQFFEGDELDIFDEFPSPETARDECSRREVLDLLSKQIDALPERYRQIILTRYFATEGRVLTLAEIAREMGLSRQRVQQLDANAKGILRKNLPELTQLI